MNILSSLRQMIRFGNITGADDSKKQFPVQQVQYNEALADVFMLFPYGMHASLSNEALIAILSIEGDDANRVGLGGYTGWRPTLEQGEVCLFHPRLKSLLVLKNDGTIQVNGATITKEGDVVTKAGNSVDQLRADFDAHFHAAAGSPPLTAAPNGVVSGNTAGPTFPPPA